MAKLNKTVIAQLTAILASGRVTAEIGKPLVDMGLIQVNTEDVVDGAAAARLTDAATAQIPKPKTVVAGGAAPVVSNIAIITNAVPPESKRGFGRVAGPEKYPFSKMEPGNSFFIPVSAEMPNPLKALGSAVSNATNKYREDTGEKKSVERTKRGDGNKAVLDAAGNKIKENVQVPVYKYPRKFVIRSVKAGIAYGGWKPETDGALITRTV